MRPQTSTRRCERGYTPLAVNEGLAVVLAELAKESFTGIGISCGGGMCNVAVSYLSIPSLTFSLAQGGDFIDSAVGEVVREPATRVKAIKEETLDLSRPGGDKIEKALRRRTLPFQVADVRLASDPLTATARGALVAALAER